MIEPVNEPPTPPAPKAFSFEALTTIGIHAKAVCEQTDTVRTIETALCEFESQNAKVVNDYLALQNKRDAARRKLAEVQDEALRSIGWTVRR